MWLVLRNGDGAVFQAELCLQSVLKCTWREGRRKGVKNFYGSRMDPIGSRVGNHKAKS